MHIIEGNTYDLIVCGCGVAGFAAAVQGARAGLKTAIVERHGMPGGILTVGGNNDIAQFFAHHRTVIRGIGLEYVRRLSDMGYAIMPDKNADGPHWIYGVNVNIPAAAYLMDTMLTKAGVALYYGQPVVSVDTSDTGNSEHPVHVDSIIIASKEGLRRLKATYFIDCTGDGDLAVYAGADYECGSDNPEDGFLQPGTIRSYVEHYPTTEEEKQAVGNLIYEKVQKGEMQDVDTNLAPYANIYGGRGNNIGHVTGFNASLSDEKTASEVAGRASIFRLMEAMREAGTPLDPYPPVIAIAPEVAHRETRRITCDGYMTAEKYVEGYEWPDAVCTSFYPIDLHRHGNNGIRQVFLTDGQVPTVPLSALTVKKTDNMLVAGRCASGDRLANSAYRVKASCMAMGQAAAACAAVAHRHKTDIRSAPLTEIRSLLRENDAVVTADDILD